MIRNWCHVSSFPKPGDLNLTFRHAFRSTLYIRVEDSCTVSRFSVKGRRKRVGGERSKKVFFFFFF